MCRSDINTNTYSAETNVLCSISKLYVNLVVMYLQIMKAYGAHELLLYLFITLVWFGGNWTASLPGPFRSGGTSPFPIS